MELVLIQDRIHAYAQSLLLLYTDGNDATESARFVVRKVDNGFELELVGGMNTVMRLGPGQTFSVLRDERNE